MLGITEFILLYFTLVLDDVLPLGYLADFSKLEVPLRRSSEKSVRLAISLTDAETEMSLDMEKKRKFCSALGTAARKDAEAAERARWVALLADLLRNTSTPMGRLLRESPPDSQLLGGGRRARTLRSRVRVTQKFLGWLALTRNLVYPTHWKQLI